MWNIMLDSALPINPGLGPVRSYGNGAMWGPVSCAGPFLHVTGQLEGNRLRRCSTATLNSFQKDSLSLEREDSAHLNIDLVWNPFCQTGSSLNPNWEAQGGTLITEPVLHHSRVHCSPSANVLLSLLNTLDTLNSCQLLCHNLLCLVLVSVQIQFPIIYSCSSRQLLRSWVVHNKGLWWQRSVSAKVERRHIRLCVASAVARGSWGEQLKTLPHSSVMHCSIKLSCDQLDLTRLTALKSL